jgi:hypothetical protein
MYDASCWRCTPCGQLDPCEPSQVSSSELHTQTKCTNVNKKICLVTREQYVYKDHKCQCQ